MREIFPIIMKPVKVRVRFDLSVASWVKEAPSNHMINIKKESNGIYITLAADRETELIPWLLSRGGSAEILSPFSLRRRIEEIASELVEKYRSVQTLF